ncbi:7454_t:CDS:2, partial [Gigaspora rosea]
MDAMIKKNKDLVSLVVPILDYQVKSPSLRDYLGWNAPPTNFILEQMHQCSTMSEDDLNFKNRLQICEAIYEYINKALSSNDKQCKSELSRGLKNQKWIFCEGNFYEAENVFFNLSENFGRDIVQLPDDYQNRFNELFKYMGVQERIDKNFLISIIEIIKDEAKYNSLTEDKLSEIIKLLEHIANECTNFKEKGQICNLKDLLIPSTDSTLLRHKDVYFDDRPKLHKAENYKISHPKITLELAEKLGILKCSKIEFETLEHSVLSTTRIKKVINGCSLDLLFKEFLKNANDAGARNFSIYLDERILDKNSENHSLLSREMHNWQGPTVWIYYDKKFEENDFSDHKNQIENVTFLDPHAKFLPLQGYPPKRSQKIMFNFLENEFLINFKDQFEPYSAIEGCDFNEEFKGTLFKLLLRSTELYKQSLISQNSIKLQEILDYFQNRKNHQELIFLRNIELYNVYHIAKNGNKHLIWEMKIQNLSDNDCRKIVYTPQIFQFNTRLYDTEKTTFETWLVCMGGNSEKSMDNNLAYSGVAATLAQSDNEDDLILIDPPNLDGKAYVYVPCERSINLGVHINGEFCWSINGKNILKSNNN